MKTVRIGTRNSPLAMKQTKIVIALLEERYPNFSYEIIPMTTKGDRLVSVSLSKIGGKGLFIKEVEQALLEKKIDFAVHSLKDMPANIADGLFIVAIPERNDPRDCLIFRKVHTIDELPVGATIGTSSLRREMQIKQLRKDLKVQSIRGNVGTRLAKMGEQELDGIVLAVAGLNRLGWFDQPTHAYQMLTTLQCIPAVGQGALAIECRSDDDEMLHFLKPIDDPLTHALVKEERAFLAELNGSCEIPIGAYAEKSANGYRFSGFLANQSTEQVYSKSNECLQLHGVGAKMAKELLGEMENG